MIKRLIAATAAVAAASLPLAAPARADVVEDWAIAYGPSVCANLDEYPTVDGVVGTAAGVMAWTGLSGFDAGRAVGYSVYLYCPYHTGLLLRFIDTYAPRKGWMV